MLNIFPFSAVCVERLFSKMRLIKTCLRSKLGQVKLDQLLPIGTDLPKEGFDNSKCKAKGSFNYLWQQRTEKTTQKSELKFVLKLLVFCFTYILF